MPSAVLLTLLATLAAGCVRPYVSPRPDQPHAIVKVRYLHHSRAGTHGGSGFAVDRHRLSQNIAPSVGEPAIEAHRVHPVLATYAAGTSFFHYELQSVQVPYTTTETYSCQQYTPSYSSSGSGSYRSSTCTRSVTRYRSEMRQVPVFDATCETSRRFAPVAGHVYLLQYEYVANGECRLSCYEQVSHFDGTFHMEACPTPVPER